QTSYELTRQARALGGASELTLAQAQTTVDSARVDLARYTSQLAQDRNALELLVGAPLLAELLPGEDGLAAGASQLVEVPAGLPSETLQRRPDVRAAEHQLRAAEADVGAARAALFPSITLTAAAGSQSSSLSGLFDGGTGNWSFAPRIDLPIFDTGRRRANVQLSEADQAIAVAGYEKTLQTAFREVADALAVRATLAEQLAAQQSLTDATARRYELSQALHQNGASSYLELLDAQRSLYAVRQALITLRLSEQLNRITLYRALGGG
ncbi:MAG TPA: efflux transporter outer membrane subunit, partial [Roseateles sp.]|nr:efflux transporter outer membrane subunit [Roseateles sp.]